MSHRVKEREEHDLRRIADDELSIVHELHFLRKAVEQLVGFFTAVPHFNVFQIYQTGDPMSAGTITGIPVGGVGTFGETDPSGFTDPTGATRLWTTSDAANTTLTPSTDTPHQQVSVAVGAGASAGGNFVLTYTDTDASGNVIGTSGPVIVPYLPAVVVAPVDFAVNQLS